MEMLITTWNVEMSDIVKQYIKHSRQCFIGISKHTENRELKYEQRNIADETRVDVFGYPMKHCLVCSKI